MYSAFLKGMHVLHLVPGGERFFILNCVLITLVRNGNISIPESVSFGSYTSSTLTQVTLKPYKRYLTVFLPYQYQWLHAVAPRAIVFHRSRHIDWPETPQTACSTPDSWQHLSTTDPT